MHCPGNASSSGNGKGAGPRAGDGYSRLAGSRLKNYRNTGHHIYSPQWLPTTEEAANLVATARTCFVPALNHNDLKERIAKDMEHLVLSCLESRSEGNGSIYGRFLVGPFKVGQGRTVATALRRTLLSELQGIAITAVEMKGATHQYCSIPGVRESTLDIVLNLKQIVLTGHLQNGLPASGYLAVQGPLTVRASDLKLPNGIRCVDKDQYIASVSANGGLTMKFVISAGKNYVSPHSPSAQTLTRSLFQPKMREGVTTPLALRASGQPSHALAKMVARNTPLDPTHGQLPLVRGGRSPHLSGSIGDVLLSTAARRVIFSTPPKETSTSPPSSAFAARGEVAGTKGSFELPQSKRLPPSLRLGEDGRTRRTADPETSKPDLVGSLRGTVSKLYSSPSMELAIAKRLGHREGIFSADIQQVSFGQPVNARTAAKLKDVGRFAEMSRNGAQPSSAPPSYHQAIKGMAHRGKRGKEWEMDSSPLPIDAVFMPVKKVNFSLQIDDQWQEPRERILLEIWTNGSVHPRQAIGEAASYLVYLFSLLRQTDVPFTAILQPPLQPRGSRWGTADQQGGRGPIHWQKVEDQGQEGKGRDGSVNSTRGTLKDESPLALTETRNDRSIDIADLDLSLPAYALLTRAGVKTLGDLMSLPIDSIWGGEIAPPAVSLEIDALLKRLPINSQS